ncbi:MAG: TonB-dependent receptor [Pyrinomonadaceae bacterium]|nr:TonB-dependent receptor [Pyrinomonadaceae bacterium]
MLSNNSKFYVLTVICLLFAPVGIFSQTAIGGISGTVKDPNGATVAGAKISLVGATTRTAQTDQRGKFNFSGVAAGNYSLRVSAEGFAADIQTVEAGKNPQNFDIALQIGESRVTVTAEIGQTSERRNIPQAVSVIGENAISQRTSSVLAQIGEEEAGLNVQRTSPTIGMVVVRGLTGKNVVVYSDGVRYTTGAQRGGINTFFNLNEPTALQSVEVLRGASSAQYGSDALGGTVNLVTKNPFLSSSDEAEFHGEVSNFYNSADRGFGGSGLFSYGTNKLGGYVNLAARRINNLRTAGENDSHSAITRFLGLPSSILYTRSPDTAFTQYGGSFRLNYSPTDDQQIVFNYQRSQQDGGRRFDQLLGGDGNLIADLRNLMLDFGYVRYVKQNFIGFDSLSATASYNSQREERVNQGGQGNPFGDITHQYERTSVNGFSFFLDKQLPKRHSLTVGGDFYHEKVNSPAYIFSPVSGLTTPSRPRVPDEARFDHGGVFAQNVWEAIPNRLRISGAVRYSAGRYKVRQSDAPIVAGKPLFGDDRVNNGAFSGRVGAVVRVTEKFRLAANYSRGFRYPSITDLGTLGLTGDGFEVDFSAATNLNGTIGTTARADAVSTGLAVETQRPEYTDNYDFSARFQSKRFDTELTAFIIDLNDTITKQTLILPNGAVGQFLGSEPIISQNVNGAVFVAAASNPVLVRSNFTSARVYGFEYELEARIRRDFKFVGNYTYIHAADRATGLPPNIEGGTPPPTAFLSLRYEPASQPFFVEAYSSLAAKQNRLSSLDLSDRRTGAPRSRSQIENFFRRGACVAGLTRNATNTCNGNVSGYTLIPTGENITQVLTRILGAGFPTRQLFTELPGYAIFNLRGGFKFGESSRVTFEFENIFDRPYRNASWGIDGAGRSLRGGYIYRF